MLRKKTVSSILASFKKTISELEERVTFIEEENITHKAEITKIEASVKENNLETKAGRKAIEKLSDIVGE